MPTLVEQLALQHLGGPLPPDFIELMRPLDNAGGEMEAFLRRAFTFMERARFRPQDFSYVLARAMTAVPGLLPGAWGGTPPPITGARRHERIDDWIEQNPYHRPEPGARLLDVGCGFPPLPSVDTSKRFPEMDVLAIDPSFGEYLVYDPTGDYACYSAAGEARFLYSAGPASQIAALQRDLPGARAHFDALRDRLLPLLPSGTSPAEASGAEGRIARDPIAAFTSGNLHFREVGFGADGLAQVDFARCMNVMGYFDPTFRHDARVWVGRLLVEGGLFVDGTNHPAQGAGRSAAYFTWQRDPGRGTLRPVEYAIDPMVLREVLSICWYTLRDDEEYVSFMCAVLSELWGADPALRAAFDTALDSALSDLRLDARRSDGFLGGPPLGASVEELAQGYRDLESRLIAEGWVERAAEVLHSATGKRAWRNAIGHLAVDPTEWGWEPVQL